MITSPQSLKQTFLGGRGETDGFLVLSSWKVFKLWLSHLTVHDVSISSVSVVLPSAIEGMSLCMYQSACVNNIFYSLLLTMLPKWLLNAFIISTSVSLIHFSVNYIDKQNHIQLQMHSFLKSCFQFICWKDHSYKEDFKLSAKQISTE